MRRSIVLALFAGVLAGIPFAADAQPAFALHAVDVFAGPGPDYPLVARIAPGFRVYVQGCVPDYQWCDVSYAGNRGWVYAGELGYPWQGARVPIVAYGPTLGIPVVSFSVGSYWDRYYRGRPWYRERDVWIHRAPHYAGSRDWDARRAAPAYRDEHREAQYRDDYRGGEVRGRATEERAHADHVRPEGELGSQNERADRGGDRDHGEQRGEPR